MGFNAFSVQLVNVVLICEAEHALANVCAVARAFPLFTRKTEGNNYASLEVEVCLPDGSEVGAGRVISSVLV